MPIFSDVSKDVAIADMMARIDRLYICSAEPTTFLEASSTFRLGVKTNPVLSGPLPGTIDGRKFEVANWTDGVVEVTGGVTHYALVDEVGETLEVVQVVSNSPEAVTALDSFTGGTISVNLRDPA